MAGIGISGSAPQLAFLALPVSTLLFLALKIVLLVMTAISLEVALCFAPPAVLVMRALMGCLFATLLETHARSAMRAIGAPKAPITAMHARMAMKVEMIVLHSNATPKTMPAISALRVSTPLLEASIAVVAVMVTGAVLVPLLALLAVLVPTEPMGALPRALMRMPLAMIAPKAHGPLRVLPSAPSVIPERKVRTASPWISVMTFPPACRALQEATTLSRAPRTATLVMRDSSAPAEPPSALSALPAKRVRTALLRLNGSMRLLRALFVLRASGALLARQRVPFAMQALRALVALLGISESMIVLAVLARRELTLLLAMPTALYAMLATKETTVWTMVNALTPAPVLLALVVATALPVPLTA